MNAEELFLWGAEVHSASKIEQAFAGGLDPNGVIRGRTPVQWLIEGMYLRSPAMAGCLRAILAAGAEIEDSALVAVALDDEAAVREELEADPVRIERKLDLECPFTPLRGASLLHVAAELGCVAAAGALLDAGADPNFRAALDGHGLNGHTPIFHTLNAHQNYGRPLLELLVERGADTDVTLQGIVWGYGFDWQTVLLDVTPLSYTLFGLLPQFQRREEDIYDNVGYLLRARGKEIVFDNVPNRYLQKG